MSPAGNKKTIPTSINVEMQAGQIGQLCVCVCYHKVMKLMIVKYINKAKLETIKSEKPNCRS